MSIVPAYLDERNREFAQKLGIDVPQLSIIKADERVESYDPRLIRLDPKFMVALDHEEATFMIAITLIHTKEFLKLCPTGTLPLSVKHSRINFVLMITVAPAMIAVMLYTSASRFTNWWWVPAALVALVSAGIPLLAKSKLFNKWILRSLPRHSSHLHAHFCEAAALTGNPNVGERYMRKSCRMSFTNNGADPFDESARKSAEAAYRANVPPEFQVRTPY